MKKLILTFLILGLIGCGEKSETDTTEATTQTRVGKAEILPLEIGTSWIYEVSALDTTVNDLRVIKTDTFSIIRDTVISGSRWFEVNGLGGEMAYATNWKEGLYYARPGGEPFLWIKYPAEVGDTFTSMIGEIEANTVMAGTGLEMKVPAGDFFCHKYIQKVGPMEMTTNYYLAPGVGLVKLEIRNRTGTSSLFEYELIKIER